MRRYLIIALAALVAFLVFITVFFLLKKVSKKNSVFYATLSGLITFIAIFLTCFLFLERDSSDIDLKYSPPKYTNGKVLDGKFDKK